MFLQKYWAAIVSNIDGKTYSALKFALYISIIFITGISSAVLTEKIYKTPYLSNEVQNNPVDSSALKGDYFNNPFGIPLFTGFFGMFYGFIMYQIFNHHNQYREEKQIPFYEFAKLSSVDVFIQTLLNLTIVMTSFTTVNLFNCCNFLSVVLFGVFFSKASQKFKVQKRQIVIAIIVSLGIIAFNVFGQSNGAGDINKTLDIWSFMLIMLVLVIEGYRPELMNQVRQKYAPPPSLCYYQISKYTFLILLVISAISTQLWKLAHFIWFHDRLALDLMLHALLDVIGCIFIYRIIICHKQHVLPFVVTIRKLLTSIFNIIYFRHNILPFQTIALSLIGGTILLELYLNYSANKEKFKEVSDTEEPPLPEKI